MPELLDDMTTEDLVNRIRENTGGSKTEITSEMALRELQYRVESAEKRETKAHVVGTLLIDLWETLMGRKL